MKLPYQRVGIAVCMLVVSIVWGMAATGDSPRSARMLSQQGCSVVYRQPEWAIDICTGDDAVTGMMRVTIDGIVCGDAGLVRVYHTSENWPGMPQVAVIYASGFVRLKQNADPTPVVPFGSSFVLGPAYWSSESANPYYHSPQLTHVDIDTRWLPTGPLHIHARGTNGAFDVSYQLTLPVPSDRQTRLHVVQTYTATTAVTIPTERREAKEGFKLVQISSMFVSEDGMCDGGFTGCHDANTARYMASDLARHQVAFATLVPSQFIFSHPFPLGSTWLDALHTDDASWQGNTPNVRIALDALPTDRTVTPQGWISATTNPNNDNVGLWLHDDGVASQAWTSGQSAQISYWLIAQDDPPEPWADLGLRGGLTFLDFEGSFNCYAVRDITKPVTATVQPTAGYTDTALELRYDLGDTDGHWAQVRCDFRPPLDLSSYDHLRFDWRGDQGAANSLDVALITRDAGGEHVFTARFDHSTHHGWWGQLIVPLRSLNAWHPGTELNLSQVVAFFVSVVKEDDVGDNGGSGRLAIDNIGVFNAATRSATVGVKAAGPQGKAARAAAQWIAAQQEPSGLVKSWAEENVCNAYTYDQALALLVFVREQRWSEADALVTALVSRQKEDGSWNQNHDCNTIQASGPIWEGDIAWAVYALSRYAAFGGREPGARTAAVRGATFLRSRVASDGCLLIDHTEATIDAWWAFHAAGWEFRNEADRIRNCLLTYYWDDVMGRFKGGRDRYQPYLDNQTWGAAFLRAIGEEAKARRALSYVEATLKLPAQGGHIFGFDGQAGPWSVWNEGTGQYVAMMGPEARDFLLELLAQQEPDGAVRASPDDFAGAGVWTTRWHGVAPTAWLYYALTGDPFRPPRLWLPVIIR